MSRRQGVLYHRLPTVNTRRGWKETESSNPPDCIYEGEIENGLPHGIGTYTKTDGATYVGHFKNGLRHGKGKFSYPDGSIYEGVWKDDELNGLGTGTFPDGEKYVGEFKEGEKHGQGKFTYTDGGWYDGSWKVGQSWTGIIYDKDGNISYEKVNGEIQYKQ